MTDDDGFDRQVVLAAVAQSYYVDRDSQEEIAEKYGFSRSNISRMLSEARRLGLVEIRVKHPIPTSTAHETALAERYPNVRVVVVRPDDMESERQIGLAAWREVERHLRPGTVLGVSWGRALSLMVDNARPVSVPGARIVEIGGAQDAIAGDRINNVAEHLGRRLGLNVVHFPAPLLADDERSAVVLLAQSSVRAVIDLACQSSAVVVGVGAIKEKLTGTRRSRFDTESARKLRDAGAVGDICGYHFDREGKVVACAQNHRVVGISPDRYRELPNKIAVAVGEFKEEAISAALAGGWVDELITDESTAEAVLRLT